MKNRDYDRSRIRLFISTFGRNTDWIKGATPIEVGAKGRDNLKYPLRDDTGDNISELNPWWGELTGLYWIWKNYNFADVDIVGFGHWGKYLKVNPSFLKKTLLGKKNAWIAVTGSSAIPHDYPEDIVAIENMLDERFPQYARAWSKTYHHDGSSKTSGNCHGGELFWTTVDEFDRYCEFLFSILFALFEIEGKVDRPKFHKRYIAFVGERLLSVYFEQYGIHCIEQDMFMYGDRGVRKAIKSFIPHGIKQTALYNRLSKVAGNGSSYG